MFVRPEVAALRADDAPQRRIQQRLVAQAAAWLESGPGAGIEPELMRFAGGAPLDELPRLAALFQPGHSAAADLVGRATDWLLGELADEPLSQVPLRHICNRTVATLMLARCHGASLAVQAIDGASLARQPAPASASFAGTETWDHVLAGSAEVERARITAHRPGGVTMERGKASVTCGEISHRKGRTEAQIITYVPGVLVTLKLQRLAGTNNPTCEYALADGALLHQAAGDPRDSRLELTAALLGRMGRGDAAPLLAAMAEEAGSTHLRWQALRECLGLDSRIGFAALSNVAQRADDPLAEPAGGLRAQLIEVHPQLAGLSQCPA
jgi:hypothetical protein